MIQIKESIATFLDYFERLFCVEGSDRHGYKQRRRIDYTMPKMNGLTLAEKTLERWPDAKVILYSGYSEHFTNQIQKSGI